MTIRKGEDWGAIGPLPSGTEICEDNESLFAAVNRDPRAAYIGLLTGDLARTVSASGSLDRFNGLDEVVILPLDLGLAHFDGGSRLFASHAVARRSWWRGRVLVVANAQFIGSWDVAPRSHPNDGFLDVVDVAASRGIRQRQAARKRLPLAGHLPHPSISTRRSREAEWVFERPLDLWLDGVKVARTSNLRVVCLADSQNICI